MFSYILKGIEKGRVGILPAYCQIFFAGETPALPSFFDTESLKLRITRRARSINR